MEDCCLHDEQVVGGASDGDDLMTRMIIMAMMMMVFMMMTPKTELGCAAASREKERAGRAREQQVELRGAEE